MNSPNKKPARPSTIVYLSLALTVGPHILTALAEGAGDALKAVILCIAGIASCLGVALAIAQGARTWLSGQESDSDTRVETMCLEYRCPRQVATTVCVFRGHQVRLRAIHH